MKPKVADKKPSHDAGGVGRSKPAAPSTGDAGGKGRSKK